MSDGAVIFWVIVRFFLGFLGFWGVVWAMDALCGKRLQRYLLG